METVMPVRSANLFLGMSLGVGSWPPRFSDILALPVRETRKNRAIRRVSPVQRWKAVDCQRRPATCNRLTRCIFNSLQDCDRLTDLNYFSTELVLGLLTIPTSPYCNSCA